MWVVIGSTAAYIVMISLNFVMIVLAYIQTGDIHPPMGILLPYCDDHSSPNFALLIALNFAVMAVSAFIVVPYDTLLYAVFTNMAMVSTEILMNLSDLEEAILQNTPLCQMKRRFYNIVLMHKRYDQ